MRTDARGSPRPNGAAYPNFDTGERARGLRMKNDNCVASRLLSRREIPREEGGGVRSPRRGAKRQEASTSGRIKKAIHGEAAK